MTKSRLRYIILVVIGLAGVTPLRAQFGTVAGSITDAESGERLPGANVIIKGTSFGDASEVDRRYSINRVPAGRHTLEVTYLGYETRAPS